MRLKKMTTEEEQKKGETNTVMSKNGAQRIVSIDDDVTAAGIVKKNRPVSLEVSARVVDATAVPVPAPVVEETSVLVEPVYRAQRDHVDTLHI